MSIDIKVLEDNPTIDVTSEKDSLNISMIDGEVVNVVDYNLTIHKPSINGNTLQGDKSSSDLGLADKHHTHKKAEITDFAHTHDDRYYLKSATDSAISKKATELGTLITASGHTIDLVMDSATYQIKALLYDGSGKLISTSTVIDLPLETLVLNVTYNSSKKAIIITLKNGTTKEVPVGDLVSGLVNEATFNAKVKELNTSIANVKTTADSANNKIDNLKIGGRNLLLGTSTEWKTASCDMYRARIPEANKDVLYEDYGLKAGDTITLGFYVKTTSGKKLRARIEFLNDSSSRTSIYGDTYIQNGEGYVYVTGMIPSNYKMIGLYADANLTMSELQTNTNEYIKCVKFEKGNKPTDWTPAPEDKANATHTHTKSQITDFAHTHDDRYYQKTETDSAYIKSATVSGRTITFTKGDGTKSTLTTQDTTYAVATQSSNGLLSSADKKKLDELSGQTTALINRIYPVGAIYLTYNNNNPSDFLGGTWERFGQGRTLIGEGTGNDGGTSKTFEANSSGGEYNHTLATGEMPSHNHSFSGSGTTGANNRGHTHSYTKATGVQGHKLTIAEIPSHNHLFAGGNNVVGDGAGYRPTNVTINGSAFQLVPYTDYTGGGGSHSHGLSTSSTASGAESQNHTHSFSYSGTTGNSGSGNAHNNIQPYITVYFWRRTA